MHIPKLDRSVNYLSIHKAQRYGEREPKDAASDFDLRHVWSIFARHVQKLEATVPIVHPAKKIHKIYMKIIQTSDNCSDIQKMIFIRKIKLFLELILGYIMYIKIIYVCVHKEKDGETHW